MIEKVDFQHSLIKWLTLKESSEASIAVESLCVLRNVAGSICTYALGPEVIAGTVYGKHPIALKPTYLFQVIASSNRHSILRSYLKHRVNSDSCRDNSDIFRSLSVHIKKRQVVVLDNFDQIESAFDRGLILSAVVMWKNDYAAVEIEFPVKHLNIQRINRSFHVETGPVIFPSIISSGWDVGSSVPEFKTAFVHFNSFSEVEFSLKVPSRLGFYLTRFYSQIRKIEASIFLFASVAEV